MYIDWNTDIISLVKGLKGESSGLFWGLETYADLSEFIYLGFDFYPTFYSLGRILNLYFLCP